MELLVILLLLLPAVAAIVVAVGFLVQRGNDETDKKEQATYRPEFVPGSTGSLRHVTTWNLIDFGMTRDAKNDKAPKLGAIQFYVGIDGMNIWLILLTSILMVSSVLISWNAVQERVHEFHAWLLLLGFGMTGVFLAFDIILFYVFFELTLVPLFFLIGIWGGPERRYAARKFFIYTLAGSLLTLLGVLGVVLFCYLEAGELTFSIPRLVEIVHERLALDSPTERAYWAAVPDVGKIIGRALGFVDREAAVGMWGGVEFW